MSVCPFRTLEWDCPKPGDGRRNQGHLWGIVLKPGEKVRCRKCGKKRRGT